MLYELLDQVCKQIENLDVDDEAPRMLAEITKARPELRRQLAQASPKPEVRNLLARAIATGALQCVKGIPEVARYLAAKTRDRRVTPQVKCAVASVLAYLVQPRDLVPDDAPGGYGYLDDSAILRAGLVEYLKLEHSSKFNLAEQEKLAHMVVSLVPPSVVPMLQLAIGTMATAFQVVAMLPGHMAELTLGQIVANPLQAAAPAAPGGFTPRPTPTYGTGHWSSGAYFEGGNVVVPGGPSLIDGQLYIPD